MKHVVKKIHFIGIGGTGMCGIAEVLLTSKHYEISGSDMTSNAATKRLKKLGATIYLGHQASNLKKVDVVVVSTAIPETNPEVMMAREMKIPVVPRAVMLAELMRLKQGIAIAGTHGKTTTTSLVASVLAQGGLDPTFVIGGRLVSAEANARLGQGDFIVAEADESDASFLNLLPVIEVITNIDADHMETYGHDFGKLKQAFVDFTNRLPFYGVAVICIDDPNVVEIIPKISKTIISYGLSEGADVRAVEIKAKNGQMHFKVKRKGEKDLKIELNLPGLHNVQNALAAIAIATELEVQDEAIIEALKQFGGVNRRFQRYGDLTTADGRMFTVIDDYGHHPVEMKATIEAARGAFVGRRLVLVFQPHRYSRTRDCFEDFANVLSTVDGLILTEVYPAGEDPIIAADGRSLARAVRVHGKVEPLFVENIIDLPGHIIEYVKDGDVLVCMGAGSIGQIPGQIVELVNECNNKLGE